MIRQHFGILPMSLWTRAAALTNSIFPPASGRCGPADIEEHACPGSLSPKQRCAVVHRTLAPSCPITASSGQARGRCFGSVTGRNFLTCSVVTAAASLPQAPRTKLST